jgi:hypothetical protein
VGAAPWEPTAWMRETIDRRLAQLDAHDPNDYDLAIGSLTGGWNPATVVGTREDRTCDRCRVYVPPRLPFWAAAVEYIDPASRTRAVLLTGLCNRCKDAEVVE